MSGSRRGRPMGLETFQAAALAQEILARGVKTQEAAIEAAIEAIRAHVNPAMRPSFESYDAVKRCCGKLRDTALGSKRVARDGKPMEKLVPASFPTGLIDDALSRVNSAAWPSGVPRPKPAPPYVPVIVARLWKDETEPE